MAFYPKKLRSKDDLEREKKALLKEREQLEKEHIFSIEGLMGARKKDDGEGGFGVGDLLDLLPMGNPVVSMVAEIVKDRFTGKEKKKERTECNTGKKEKSILSSVAKEFIGGYLKWKAIELSYKGLRYIIRKQRNKKG